MKLSKIEIQLLTEDVRNNINQTLEITKFSIAASCVLLGFGLGNFEGKGFLASLICLLPIPILAAAVEMVFNRRINIMRKATFLRNYGGDDYVWEAFLRQLRVNKKEHTSKSDRSFTKTLLRMLLGMSLLSLAAAIVLFSSRIMDPEFNNLLSRSASQKIEIIFTLLFLIVAGIFSCTYFCRKWKEVDSILMGGDAEQANAKDWKKVEKQVIKIG